MGQDVGFGEEKVRMHERLSLATRRGARCLVTVLFDLGCIVPLLGMCVAGGLFRNVFAESSGRDKVWREEGKYAHKFLVDNGKRPRDLRFLTSCILFSVPAS